jgi:hypothetical protein
MPLHSEYVSSGYDGWALKKLLALQMASIFTCGQLILQNFRMGI